MNQESTYPKPTTLATEKRLPVSVCMVASAEAHRITPALESVSSWAQEIIVVLDAAAKDGTDAVARRFGAKVFVEPWKGFVRQKNSAAQKCAAPWLLNLDADEVVTAALRREITDIVLEKAAPHTAYEFPRCTFYCGRWIRHGDWYPDRVCRLWKRDRAYWVGEEPHARLEVSGSVGRLKSDLQHFSNETIARQIAKIAPYQAETVKRRTREGKPAGFFDLALRPWWRFFRAYVLRLGWLDGWQGFYIACLSSFSTLTRYAMLHEARVPKEPAQPPASNPPP